MTKSFIESFHVNMKDPNVVVLAISLAANLTSSYRDVSNMSTLCINKFDIKEITIVTDNAQKVQVNNPKVTIVVPTNKVDFLGRITEFVARVQQKSTIVFTLSAHGYTKKASRDRIAFEMDKHTEYIKFGNEMITDTELFEALYSKMHDSIKSVCFIDTCHSGTMLDLEYLSNDGKTFHRSPVANMSRPDSVCISACSDNELVGEDISEYGGWGGKLTCALLDYLHLLQGTTLSPILFYRHIHTIFTAQTTQRSVPIISFNE